MIAQTPKVETSIGNLAAEVAFGPARILLLAMLFLSPWYYGSVSWQAQTYYLPVAALILFLAIFGAVIRKEAVGNPLIWCMAALLSFALIQTVQLPEWLWQRVSMSAAFERQTSEIEAEFLHSATNGLETNGTETVKIEETPRTLSIHWVQTRASIAMFAITLACLLSAGILFRTRAWEVALLSVLAVSGLGIAMVGLLQSVAWNKWTLLPMPTSTYFATFVSRNSAPQFLAIGLGGVLGLLAWWNGSKSDEADKRYYVRYPAINALARFRRRLEELVTDLDALSLTCVFSATLIFVAVLAAGSRGGILSCLASAVLTLCISFGATKSYTRTLGLVAVMGCGAMLLLTTLELDNAIWTRMDSVNEEAYELSNGRFLVWQMILSQPSCWLPGCGLGNFHFAILPAYRGEPTAWFYHAENIYMEMLAEFGVVGFAIGVTGIVWLMFRIRWCMVTGRQAAPTFVATILSVSAIALQNLVDFSLIIPAICLPLAALVGCFLARSYCPDFGKKPKKGELRKTDVRKSGGRDPGKIQPMSHWTNIPASVSILTLTLFSMWVAAKPLAGYAFAERLQSQSSQLEKSSRSKAGQGIAKSGSEFAQLIEDIDVAQVKRFADNPEVNLQIGLLLQVFAREMFAEHLDWPPNVTAMDKKTLSEPANIAAAYRTTNDPRMTAFRELTEQLPQQIEALRRSAVRMASAASVCSFDWRCELGMLRSDLNWLTPQARAQNYARLLLVTGQSSQVPASVGAAALLAGEKQIGNRFLHDYLVRNPKQGVAISTSIVQQMSDASPAETIRELLAILPNSLLSRAEVAENFFRKPGLQSISKQLALSIDLDELIAQADSQTKDPHDAKPWLLIAWLANERRDPSRQIDALLHAVNADRTNHRLRFELAELLLANGRIDEAFDQAGKASRQSPETQQYKDFLDRIRQLKESQPKPN